MSDPVGSASSPVRTAVTPAVSEPAGGREVGPAPSDPRPDTNPTDAFTAERTPGLYPRRVDLGIPTLEGLTRREMGPAAARALLDARAAGQRPRASGPRALPPMDLSRLELERTPEMLEQLQRAQARTQAAITGAVQAELSRAGLRTANDLSQLPPHQARLVQQRIDAAAESAARSAVQDALLELAQPHRERVERFVLDWLGLAPAGAKMGLGVTALLGLLASGQEVGEQVNFTDTGAGLTLRVGAGVSQSHARAEVNVELSLSKGVTLSTRVSGQVDLVGGVASPDRATGTGSVHTGLRINLGGV